MRRRLCAGARFLRVEARRGRLMIAGWSGTRRRPGHVSSILQKPPHTRVEARRGRLMIAGLSGTRRRPGCPARHVSSVLQKRGPVLTDAPACAHFACLQRRDQRYFLPARIYEPPRSQPRKGMPMLIDIMFILPAARAFMHKCAQTHFLKCALILEAYRR